jgi:phytoene dehydrogenase-like protein
MAAEYDVIVVGAGPGGTCCAALLANKGLNVLLLDKNARVGGKQMDTEVKGTHGERWATGGFAVRSGPFHDVYRTLGIESQLKVIAKPIVAIYRRTGMTWQQALKPPQIIDIDMENYKGMDPNFLFDQWGLEGKDRDTAIQMLVEMASWTPEQLEKLDDITITDWFDGRPEIPYPLRRYLCYVTQVMQECLPDIAPMSLVSGIFHYGAQPMGYPKGGYGHVVEVVAEKFKDMGGKLVTRSRVERIAVEGGCAVAVMTKDAVYRAPIIVSDAGIQPTVLSLVGEEYFDKSYVAYVKGLLPSLGYNGVRYILKEKVLPHALYQIWSDDSWWDIKEYMRIKNGGIPKDVTIAMIVPSNYDPDMAPPGKQVLVFGTNCSPDTRDEAMLKMLNKRMEEQLAEIFPEIVPAIESKAYAGPREVAALSRDAALPGMGGEFNLAISIGQTGKYKPSAKSPIPGLYYVGMDAGSNKRLLGSNNPVDSAINVAQMAYQYHLDRRFAGW